MLYRSRQLGKQYFFYVHKEHELLKHPVDFKSTSILAITGNRPRNALNPGGRMQRDLLNRFSKGNFVNFFFSPINKADI